MSANRPYKPYRLSTEDPVKRYGSMDVAEHKFKNKHMNEDEKVPLEHTEYQSADEAPQQDDMRKARDAMTTLNTLSRLMREIEKDHDLISNICNLHNAHLTSQTTPNQNISDDNTLNSYTIFIIRVETALRHKKIFEEQFEELQTSTGDDPKLAVDLSRMEQHYNQFKTYYERKLEAYAVYSQTLKQIIENYKKHNTIDQKYGATPTSTSTVCTSLNLRDEKKIVGHKAQQPVRTIAEIELHMPVIKEALKELREKVSAINQIPSDDRGRIQRYAVATESDLQQGVIAELKANRSRFNCCNDFIEHVEAANERRTYLNEILKSIGDDLSSHPEYRSTNRLGERFEALKKSYDTFKDTDRNDRKLEIYMKSIDNLKAIIDLYQKQSTTTDEKHPTQAAQAKQR